MAIKSISFSPALQEIGEEAFEETDVTQIKLFSEVKRLGKNLFKN